MFIWIVALLLCINMSRCSLVIDSLSQKSPHLSEYCKKTEFCEEGTHVMCMFYDPKQVMGPRCSNSQNISMTPDIADKLLEVSNAVRSRIALGKEIGKHGPLPRGYGIFRLSWDEELATFAQVLANQCVLTRDLCRATKRFSNPGQATGLVRFSFPDWLPVSNKSYFTTSKLTPPKLNYAMTQTMKSWYSQKNYVTPEMILNYPDFQQKLISQFGKLYLKMIHGPATHMGCGISAYTQFAYHDNNSPLNYNVVQVVCNYSARPAAGKPVYTTTPPTQIGYTIRCGCPEGFDEDADCLCFENRKQPVLSPSPQNYCSDDSCKQSVVLLPIFTMEDAPPHKLLPPHNYSRRIGQSETYNYENYMVNMPIIEPQNLNEFKELLKGSDVARTKSSVIQRRFEQRKPSKKQHDFTKSNLPALSHVPRKHTLKHNSIFSRAEKFQLPTRKVVSYRVDKNVKKDVAPRKDFSNVQELLKTYLNKKRINVGNIFNRAQLTSNERFIPKENDQHIVPANNLIQKSKVTDPYRTLDTNLNLKSGYKELNATNHIKDIVKPHINDSHDKKLMTLLENLEKEVKLVELDSTDRDVFDSRIRKIYNRLVDKRNYQIHPIQVIAKDKRLNEEMNENLLNYEIAADNEFMNKEKLNKKASGSNKFNLYDDGLIKRNQNSIRSTNNNYRDVYRDNKHAINNKDIFYTKTDINTDNGLSYDRRKYYQDKLDELQRKLRVRSNWQNSVNSPRHVMPVRPLKNEMMRPSQLKQMDTFYIPDRARFIQQGFR